MRTKLVLFFALLLLSRAAFASGSGLLRSGNSAYNNQKYGIAFDLYQQAAHKGSPAYGQYNSGAALYRLKDYNNAAKAYLDAAEQDPNLKQNAYFNAGNAYYNTDKTKAAALYRSAYLMNLKDEEALNNLQLTLQEQQKDKDNQNNQNNKDNNNQNNQDKQNNKNNKSDNQQEKQDKGQNNISKEEADSVLQMLKEQGNNVLPPAAKPRQETVDKDW